MGAERVEITADLIQADIEYLAANRSKLESQKQEVFDLQIEIAALDARRIVVEEGIRTHEATAQALSDEDTRLDAALQQHARDIEALQSQRESLKQKQAVIKSELKPLAEALLRAGFSQTDLHTLKISPPAESPTKKLMESKPSQNAGTSQDQLLEEYAKLRLLLIEFFTHIRVKNRTIDKILVQLERPYNKGNVVEISNNIQDLIRKLPQGFALYQPPTMKKTAAKSKSALNTPKVVNVKEKGEIKMYPKHDWLLNLSDNLKGYLETKWFKSRNHKESAKRLLNRLEGMRKIENLLAILVLDKRLDPAYMMQEDDSSEQLIELNPENENTLAEGFEIYQKLKRDFESGKIKERGRNGKESYLYKLYQSAIRDFEERVGLLIDSAAEARKRENIIEKLKGAKERKASELEDREAESAQKKSQNQARTSDITDKRNRVKKSERKIVKLRGEVNKLQAETDAAEATKGVYEKAKLNRGTQKAQVSSKHVRTLEAYSEAETRYKTELGTFRRLTAGLNLLRAKFNVARSTARAESLAKGSARTAKNFAQSARKQAEAEASQTKKQSVADKTQGEAKVPYAFETAAEVLTATKTMLAEKMEGELQAALKAESVDTGISAVRSLPVGAYTCKSSDSASQASVRGMFAQPKVPQPQEGVSDQGQEPESDDTEIKAP